MNYSGCNPQDQADLQRLGFTGSFITRKHPSATQSDLKSLQGNTGYPVNDLFLNYPRHHPAFLVAPNPAYGSTSSPSPVAYRPEKMTSPAPPSLDHRQADASRSPTSSLFSQTPSWHGSECTLAINGIDNDSEPRLVSTTRTYEPPALNRGFVIAHPHLLAQEDESPSSNAIPTSIAECRVLYKEFFDYWDAKFLKRNGKLRSYRKLGINYPGTIEEEKVYWTWYWNHGFVQE